MSLSKFKNNKRAKNGPIYTLKFNFIGSQFYKGISNFGYFKKLKKSEYRRKQLKNLSICVPIQELIKN